MRTTIATMGTVASIDVPVEHEGSIEELERLFRSIESRFSLYLAESELSAIASGRLRLMDASPELLASYDRSIRWRSATEGLFSPHRPDGVLDLNGIVKAEAIEAAGALLDSAGCTSWSINVGGDILTRSTGPAWITGIADPAHDDALLGTVDLGTGRRAIATSGSAQRGDHIWRGGQWAGDSFVQVSVLADDIVTADVLATAIIAGGQTALDDLADRWPVDILAVDRGGALLASPGFRAALLAR